jgi:hypothetical protein
LGLIPEDTKKKVVDLWVDGYTYREIGVKLMLSLGTISSIIHQAKKEIPDLRFLKGLNKWLKKKEVSAMEALRGVNLRKQLDDLDITPEILQDFIDLSKNLALQTGTDQITYTKAGLRLMNLEQNTHKNYETILQDYQQIEFKIPILQKKKAKVTKQITQQKRLLKELEKEGKIQDKKLWEAIKTHQRLKEIGQEKLSKFAELVPLLDRLDFDQKELIDLILMKQKLA